MKYAHYMLLPALLLLPTSLCAEPTEVRLRVTGFFQPDRKEDLLRDAEGLPDVKVKSIDYANAVVTFVYESSEKPFKDAQPDQVQKQIDMLVRKVSNNTFTVLPLSTLPREKWEEVQIGVAGLDCKGCAFAAYNMVMRVEGVEHAVVSFKEGTLTAWIDSTKTKRETLEAALKKGEVRVTAPPAPKPSK